MGRFFVMMAIALVSLAVAGTALSWDGSYHFYGALQYQSPRIPNHRYLHWVLQGPAVWLSTWTDQLGVIRLVFNLGYAGIPLLALGFCGWILRTRATVQQRRSLFLWPVLGICIVPLPGQLFLTSEGMMVLQLAWPLALGLLLGVDGGQALGLMVLVAAMFFAHPFAMPVFVALAILAGLVGWKTRLGWKTQLGQKPGRVKTAAYFGLVAVFLGLAGLAWVNLKARATPYESQKLSSLPGLGAGTGTEAQILEKLANVAQSLWGWPLLGLGAAIALGLWVWCDRPRALGYARWAGLLVLVCFVIYGGVPAFWRNALDYRYFLLPFSLPFAVLLVLDWWRGSCSRVGAIARQQLVGLLGLTFMLTLVLQGVHWVQLEQQVRATLAGSSQVCLTTGDRATFAWLAESPLNHWSLTPLSLVVQGKAPQKMIVWQTGCEASTFEMGLPIAKGDQEVWTPRQWFDTRGLRQALVAAQGPVAPPLDARQQHN